MKLRYDPFQVFQYSKTPPGLYARQKWLAQADMPGWQRDFQAVVKALLADQLPDGSWQHDPVATIKALFGLHLTLRSANERIDAALAWLLKRMNLGPDGTIIRSAAAIEGADLAGLPFVASRPSMFLTGATLFLASIFDRPNDRAVLAAHRRLSEQGLDKEGLRLDIASLHNIFRALVVHPEFANSHLTATVVDIFRDLQTEEGDWGPQIPFYQALNALAHLNHPQAASQVERAWARLLDLQNSDGTWSRREPEWNTFLAIHALKNKKLL
jgi:hypothetical protein